MIKFVPACFFQTVVVSIFLCTLTILSVSCDNRARNDVSDNKPKNAQKIQLVLEDSLGKITLCVPNRYDTVFSWINYSDCGKACDEKKYRFQPKTLPIVKESGWVFLNKPKDSVEQITLTHKEFFPFHHLDTTKNVRSYNYIKYRLSEDETNPPLVFDTLQRIGDRYYSIFGMRKLDSITVMKVVAVTTIENNLIYFEYELRTTKKDSIMTSFMDNSLTLIKTLHISRKP